MHIEPLQEQENNVKIEIRGKTFLLHNTLLDAPYPQAISLESTNFCNLTCSHCGHSQFTKFNKGHLDIKYLHKIQHLLGSKIKAVSLSNFGEPFISKVWHTLLEKVISIDEINISFITNGLLLDKHIDEILNPRISIAISIDGASEKTYSYFRGSNNFSKLLFNLNLLKNLKVERKISFPHITFLFTVSRVNVNELKDIVEMAKTYGVETVIVQLQLFFKKERFTKESLYFAKEEYNVHIALARKKALEAGINLIHPDSFDEKTIIQRDTVINSWLGKDSEGSIKCFSLFATCYIKYNGVVEACCAPNHNVMGDLESDSFEDIWHGPYYRELRLAFDRGEWLNRCRYCNLIQAIDVHDIRAHLVEVPETDPVIESFPQSYRISEIETIYKEAISSLPDNNKALKVISQVADADVNLHEIGNLIACLHGMSGEIEIMRKELEKYRKIAPKDPFISTNYNKLAELTKKKGFSRIFKW